MLYICDLYCISCRDITLYSKSAYGLAPTLLIAQVASILWSHMQLLWNSIAATRVFMTR